MNVREYAQPLHGWYRVIDGIPEYGTKVEILHFGQWPDEYQVYDTAIVDRWGLKPQTESGHGKRSTITHWRPVEMEISE